MAVTLICGLASNALSEPQRNDSDTLRKELGDGQIYENPPPPEDMDAWEREQTKIHKLVPREFGLQKTKDLKLTHSPDFRPVVSVATTTGERDQRDLPGINTMFSYGLGTVGKYSVARVRLRALAGSPKPARIDAVFITNRGRNLRTIEIDKENPALLIELFGPFLSQPEFTLRKFKLDDAFGGESVGKVPAWSTELTGLELMISDTHDKMLYFGGWPSAPSLPIRTFTSSDGRALAGKIQSVRGGKVRMLVSGKSYRLSLDRFADQDRQFLTSLQKIEQYRKAWGASTSSLSPKPPAPNSSDDGIE